MQRPQAKAVFPNLTCLVPIQEIPTRIAKFVTIVLYKKNSKAVNLQ